MTRQHAEVKKTACVPRRDPVKLLPVLPMQTRSRMRVTAMLDEAERMIAHGGLGALSLPQLAERVGIPRAGVYRHFPGPEALLLALAERYLAEREKLIPSAWGRATDWRKGLSQLVSAAAGYYTTRPAARAVLLHWGMSPEIAAAYRATVDRLSATVRQLFEVRARVPELPRDPDVYTVAVEIVTSLFALSERRHGEITKSFVGEAQRAAEAYLSTCLRNHQPDQVSAPSRGSRRQNG